MTGPPAVPLSVLDLSPVPAGGTAADALHNTIDLARAAERAGYHRFWVAEHHLNTGVASSSTPVLVALVAAATEGIRVGSGAVQLPNTRPLQVAEQFGTVAAVHPGRVDVGLGRLDLHKILRSIERGRIERGRIERGRIEQGRIEQGRIEQGRIEQGRIEQGRAADAGPSPPRTPPARVVDGLLVPAPGRVAGDLSLFGALGALLGFDAADPPPDHRAQVGDVLSYFEGTARRPDGQPLHVLPAEGADVELLVLGSSPGVSAQVAGELGLPFAASYHSVPHTVLDTVAAYRAAFRPGRRARPHVLVSADVVVAEDDAAARELAAPYGQWVLDIRSGRGAQPYVSPAQARARRWTDAERAGVADRVDTQFVGSPATVAGQLATLARATGADELLVTTITTEHADRVRSHELLAREWATRSAPHAERETA